ncbi:hypothetical protein QJS10_CPA03g01126 [Acorus calamus]|uniref:Rab3 GTPase-activating protein catalytic subunit n=1 Tax=Acorus calamus TaxID=4465 RepID=A0AAV9F6K3_ACOCL|nr:hypothetical protein QJS10_CPA03g01126 [Acorus calamus]
MHDSTLLSDDQISKKRTGVSPSKSENVFASPNIAESRRGSACIVQSTMLLRSPQKMHAPYTQDAPLMTEDMHEERLRAAETFGDAFNFSGQLEKDILSSDMSAFKAANPGAVFEDFIRWHSPGDWESEETSKNGSFIDDEFEAQNTKWPPSGRLSQRMSEQGNSWRKIWNDSPALAVFEQKPLLDPNKEGEKILHYLETLKPHQLIEQMVCTAFRASVDTLSLTLFGNLKQLRTKIGQLYLTIASTLKPLGANHLHDDELIDDLKRLCLVFEHIEKLVMLAASMHRRLLNVPRLCEAIFSDYFNFYIPKMGTSSTSICYEKEFNIREPVRMQERPSIESMFTPPTTNQSWRKVLSMGNLLNGHEPTLREIVLSVHDSMSGNHYGTGNTQSTSDEIETHRMYIRGTSNDLQVALSVTSCD